MFSSVLNIQQTHPLRIYNTNSMYDLLTGSVIRGTDGKWKIHGGLPSGITGIVGKENTYKSTFANNLMLNAMRCYSESENVTVETEGAYDEQRLMSLCGNEVDLNKIIFLSGTIYNLDATYDVIKEICKEKEKNKKKYTVQTPFIDLRTGKLAEAYIPTFISIDSYTEMYSVTEQDMMNEGGIDSKKNQTIYMVDGNKKTLFIRNIRKLCETHGLCVCLTAHVGKNIDMGGYGPVAKQLPAMRQSDRLKNVGSKFTFLTRNCSQIMSTKLLQDSNKNSLYCQGETPATDLHEIAVSMIRCKENSSGTIFPFVVSQSLGLLKDASHYNYLRNNGYYGLVGNKQRHSSALIPDNQLTRNSVREKCKESYELSRALEITARYLFIKNNWITGNLPMSFSRSPEELYEAITKSNSIEMNDILNSENAWRYNRTKDNREYLSVFDIVEKLN